MCSPWGGSGVYPCPGSPPTPGGMLRGWGGVGAELPCCLPPGAVPSASCVSVPGQGPPLCVLMPGQGPPPMLWVSAGTLLPAPVHAQAAPAPLECMAGPPPQPSVGQRPRSWARGGGVPAPAASPSALPSGQGLCTISPSPCWGHSGGSHPGSCSPLLCPGSEPASARGWGAGSCSHPFLAPPPCPHLPPGSRAGA